MNPILSAPLFFPPTIHSPYYADSTETTTSITLQSGNAIQTMVGQELPLIGEEEVWRFGLSSSISLDFRDNENLGFSPQSFDGYVGLPLDIHIGPWENRFSLNHLSAHMMDNYLIESHSREWVTYQTAYRIAWFRPYLGARKTYHSGDKKNSNWRFQAGSTAHSENREISPYIGWDYRVESETDYIPTLSFQGGARWQGVEYGHDLRFGCIYYSGLRDAGQFYNIPETYYGFTLGFDQ